MFVERQQTQEAADLWYQLRDAQLQLVEAEAHRDDLVRELLDAGATWRLIGIALGVSPQAAYKRYKPRFGHCYAYDKRHGAGTSS